MIITINTETEVDKICQFLNGLGVEYAIKSIPKAMTEKETMEHILRICCKVTKQDYHVILSKCRKREYVLTRNLFAYVTKTEFPKITLVNMGRFLGGRDHSSILNNFENVHNAINGKFAQIEENKELANMINLIKSQI